MSDNNDYYTDSELVCRYNKNKKKIKRKYAGKFRSTNTERINDSDTTETDSQDESDEYDSDNMIITIVEYDLIDDERNNDETNIRALSKYADTYELEKFEKNVLLIFNHENVRGYEPRYGTEKDVDFLKNTFSRFGFEVYVYKDLRKKEIFDTLQAFSKQNFTDYGCVGIAVLTHGSEYGRLWAKDHRYSEIEIINYFKVHDKPTLVTKPKFLIIQACRGADVIPGIKVMPGRAITERIDQYSSKEPYILPVEADMLIIHSSYIKSPSYRDEVYGSWFVQCLCDNINQLAATHDVESIITKVKRDVAIDKEHEIYNTRTLEMQVNKQMPVMTSTLIRKLFFKKFGDPPALPFTLPNCANCQGCRNGSNEILDSGPPRTPSPVLVQLDPCSGV